MAGRNTASPLLSRITSCSCSHSRARSLNLSGSLIWLLRLRLRLMGVSNLPSVVSARRSVPLVPLGMVESRCSNNSLGAGPAQLRRLHQGPPFPLQRHLHCVSVPAPDRQAAPTATLSPPIGGDATDDSPKSLRKGIVVAVVPESLVSEPEMECRGIAALHVRSRLPHEVDERLLHRRRLLESSQGRVLHPGVDKSRERGIVAGDSDGFQVVERLSQHPPSPGRRPPSARQC